MGFVSEDNKERKIVLSECVKESVDGLELDVRVKEKSDVGFAGKDDMDVETIRFLGGF